MYIMALDIVRFAESGNCYNNHNSKPIFWVTKHINVHVYRVSGKNIIENMPKSADLVKILFLSNFSMNNLLYLYMLYEYDTSILLSAGVTRQIQCKTSAGMNQGLEDT